MHKKIIITIYIMLFFILQLHGLSGFYHLLLLMSNFSSMDP